MLTIFTVVAALAAAVVAIPADPIGITIPAPAATTTAVGPNPTEVYIKAISYGGTGCPQGTVGQFISTDKQTFTLIFDAYVASIGPGIAITNNRLNCQLNIDLQYPGGFQYSILGTQFRGYAGLDDGITGLQQATYYFSGSSTQVSTSTTFKGPFSSDYEVSDTIPFTSTIFSPCGAALPLNINSQVRLTSTKASASGIMTHDSIDGKIAFQVGVQWQKCTK